MALTGVRTASQATFLLHRVTDTGGSGPLVQDCRTLQCDAESQKQPSGSRVMTCTAQSPGVSATVGIAPAFAIRRTERQNCDRGTPRGTVPKEQECSIRSRMRPLTGAALICAGWAAPQSLQTSRAEEGCASSRGFECVRSTLSKLRGMISCRPASCCGGCIEMLVEMAGCDVADAQRARLGHLAAAALEETRTASVKSAATRRIDRARHVALQDHAAARDAGLNGRHGRKERTRVGVGRRAKGALARSDFDDLAEIHDRDAMGHVLDDRQVVADEQQRQPEVALQVLQQVDDLRLSFSSLSAAPASHREACLRASRSPRPRQPEVARGGE